MTKTLKEFRRKQPRRYQPVPTILKKTADSLAYTITSMCGSKNPKIREVAIEVDFKGEIPVATLRSRYLRKWSKVAEFPIAQQESFNFQPALALR